MANAKAKCAACKTYRLRAELQRVGLSNVCSDNDDCRKGMLTKQRELARRQQANREKRNHKPRTHGRMRVQIRRRDGGVCRFCGASAYRMELHHIQYRSQGGPDANWNLILLCDEHHRLVHSSKRKWQPILRAVIWAHYVEGRFYTVPEMERRLRKEGVQVDLVDGLPEADY